MVDITVADGKARFRVQGWDRLWSFTGELDVPLAHIRDARADATAARRWWHGIKRVFWDVYDPDKTIVVELADEGFDELIVEVADPAAAVDQVRAALGGRA